MYYLITNNTSHVARTKSSDEFGASKDKRAAITAAETQAMRRLKALQLEYLLTKDSEVFK